MKLLDLSTWGEVPLRFESKPSLDIKGNHLMQCSLCPYEISPFKTKRISDLQKTLSDLENKVYVKVGVAMSEMKRLEEKY
jgi:hypothetical protein